jgi:hypothetical protein
VPRKSEYRPFTQAAAAQIAKEFDVTEHAGVIFKRVTGAANAYKRFRSRPNYQQVRNALEELAKPLRQATRAATKYRATLAKALHGTLLRRWGELFTDEAIYELSGEYVDIPPHVRAISDPDDFKTRVRLYRSVAASQAGGKLLVPFFQEMLTQVEHSLTQLGPPARGRRIKHLFRLYLIMELAELYEWLFELRPTSTANGKFTKFCLAILDEMQFDTSGVEDAIADALKREKATSKGSHARI